MNQSKTTLFRSRNLKGLVFLSPDNRGTLKTIPFWNRLQNSTGHKALMRMFCHLLQCPKRMLAFRKLEKAVDFSGNKHFLGGLSLGVHAHLATSEICEFSVIFCLLSPLIFCSLSANCLLLAGFSPDMVCSWAVHCAKAVHTELPKMGHPICQEKI